jgi:hypothetical protein
MSTAPPNEPTRSYGGAPPAGGWQGPGAGPTAGGYAYPETYPEAPPVAPPVPPAPPAGWAQTPPGYADPAYNQAYGQAPGYRPRRARRTGPSYITVAPALVASLAICIGIIVQFLGNLFVALGAPKGTAGRDRLLQFLSTADLAAAAALVLAVGLVVLQRQGPGVAAPVVGPRGGRVRSIALVAGVVAVVVAFAALLRGIVYLTVPHQPGAVKIGYFIVSLAVALIASAAAAWSLRSRW